MLSTLVYASHPRLADPDADLGAIAEASQRNNVNADITGALYHTEALFLQVLEGDLEALAATFGRIWRDNRHEGITVLFEADLASRLFGAWEMRFVDGAKRPVLPPETTPGELAIWDIGSVSTVVGTLRYA